MINLNFWTKVNFDGQGTTEKTGAFAESVVKLITGHFTNNENPTWRDKMKIVHQHSVKMPTKPVTIKTAARLLGTDEEEVRLLLALVRKEMRKERIKE